MPTANSYREVEDEESHLMIPHVEPLNQKRGFHVGDLTFRYT